MQEGSTLLWSQRCLIDLLLGAYPVGLRCCCPMGHRWKSMSFRASAADAGSWQAVHKHLRMGTANWGGHD